MPENPTLTLTLPDGIRPSAAVLEDCLERGVKWRELRDMPESRRPDSYDADKARTYRDLMDANAEYDLSQRVERDVFERAVLEAALAAPPRPESRGPQAAFSETRGEGRSAGAQFVESERYAGAGSANDIRGHEVEVRNLLWTSATGTPAAGLFAPVGQPFLSPGGVRRQRLFVRDLLSVQQTGLGSIPYIRELNAATNETAASAVAEASAKPEVTMEFERDDAPVRKLAAWIQATEEVLMDAATLRGYIDERLGYMVQLREEKQVIGVGAGGGNAPNLKGILDFTGVQTNTGLFYDGVGTSIGKIELVDGDADGVAVNPGDFWAAVTDRHTDFYDGNAFGIGGGAPFEMPRITAWGLPVVRTRSLASGTAIVGSWRMGATLFEREGVTIRTTDSHASLFISNTWVILAEERVALAVHRPDFFVKLTVTAPS